jgi:hypothetical protein
VGFFNRPAFLQIAEWAHEQKTSGVVKGFTPTAMNPDLGGGIHEVVWSDIFGSDPAEDPNAPVSRAMAMRQPAFARARGVLLSVIARYPWVDWTGDERTDPQPKWLSRTDTGISPQKRMVDTFDDVFWRKHALWLVLRGPGVDEAPTGRATVNKLGPILDAVHIPYDLWRFDKLGNVEMNASANHWVQLPVGSYVLFEGFQDGLLTMGASVIRTSDGIQQSIAARARSPIPLIDLHMTEDLALTKEEKAELRSDWVRARSSVEGAVAITPHNVEVNVLGNDTSEFLDQARNSQRLDAANLTQLPAGLLDGTTSTASLTYSTQEGRRVEFHDYGLNLWRTVFESRLSMDDVSPAGHRIELDLTDLYQLPDDGTGPALED